MSDNTARRIVDREVHVCLSSLVATLARAYGDGCERGDIGDVCSQAFELAAPVADWLQAANEDGAKLHFNEGKGAWCVLDQNDNDLWHAWFSTEEDAARAYCDQHGVEPWDGEVFEHWAVSSWLADKLEAHGEKVDRDFAGLIVWARTTTGQAIYADSVIQAIAAEIDEASSC